MPHTQTLSFIVRGTEKLIPEFMKYYIMESLCLVHYSLRLDWCADICLIGGIFLFSCLRRHNGESVHISLGHTDRKLC
jgi:hypothetical protein